MTPPRNPFRFGKPVTSEHFVGRWPLVEKMAEQLIQNDGPSYAVIGGRSIGKSSLLAVLADYLRRPESQAAGDWVPLPIYFNFKEGPYDSAGVVLARLLDAVRRHTDRTATKPAKNAWPKLIRIREPWYTKLTEKVELTLTELQDCLQGILEVLPSPNGKVRFVFLVDEVDESIEEEWAGNLFNQVSALTVQGDLSEQVSVVLAGSGRFLNGSGESSFWNALTPQYLGALSAEAVQELAAQSESIPSEIVEAVVAQSGGHPWMAQYLLFHAWEEQQTPTEPGNQFNETLIEKLAFRFRHDEADSLKVLASSVGFTGLITYDILLSRKDWVAESELLTALNDPLLNVSRDLHALCYNGLAIHDGHYEKYRPIGQIFQTWYVDNKEWLQEDLRKMESASDGPSSGLIIDIGKIIQTDGGAYIGRDANVSDGNLIGRDQKNIQDYG